MIDVVAKLDAGVLNYRTTQFVITSEPKTDKEVWPIRKNGRLLNNSFKIIKGKKYQMSKDYKQEENKGLWTIFEKVEK